MKAKKRYNKKLEKWEKKAATFMNNNNSQFPSQFKYSVNNTDIEKNGAEKSNLQKLCDQSTEYGVSQSRIEWHVQELIKTVSILQIGVEDLNEKIENVNCELNKMQKTYNNLKNDFDKVIQKIRKNKTQIDLLWDFAKYMTSCVPNIPAIIKKQEVLSVWKTLRKRKNSMVIIKEKKES